MHEPSYYSGNLFGVNPEQVSSHARKVVDTLCAHNYKAYIVGGGIRDLLLGLKPKDFDVATDATPDEILSLFRRARPIGRRFKIVHVRSGPELIEVSTFRGNHHAADEESRSATGQLLRDNTFGSMEEDAIRRDFTINSLFYDPQENQIIDYVGGLEDLKANSLRLIGDPEQRYREDPVRMLRAARFAAKLGFDIESETEKAIHEFGSLLVGIPAARLFDETLKLLLAGDGARTYPVLDHYGLLQYLLPEVGQLPAKSRDPLILAGLKNSDDRIRHAQSVTPAFLFATLLWPPFVTELKRYYKGMDSRMPELLAAAGEVISKTVKVTSIPKRFSLPMRDIWFMQWRLEQRDPRRIQRLVEHKRFRAAYDFLLLRAESGEPVAEAADWWTQFQASSGKDKQAMIESLPRSAGTRKRRPRRRKKQT